MIEEVDNERAKRIKERIINCEKHSVNRNAFVCHHLVGAKNIGFEEAFSTFKGMELGDEDDLQAWCNKCEVERLKTNDWNDESMRFAQIKLVCEDCYFEIKAKNIKH